MDTANEEIFKTNSSDQQRKTQYQDLLKYTGLFGGVQGLNLLSSLVRNKLSALLLGPAGLGAIALFSSVISMLSNATSLGISFSGVRNLSDLTRDENQQKIHDYTQVIRCWSFLTAIFGVLLCLFMAPLLSDWTFGDASYTSSFRWLSLVIGLTALTGGELAILKGVRRLRQVAVSSVSATFLSLFIVIPLYYFYRQAAIVPALIVVSALSLCATGYYSFRLFPIRRTLFSRRHIRGGIPLVKLGLSFVVAGTFGAVAEYLIRAFIVERGSVELVGFYNTGLVLCVSYMGMIFVAIDNDYFSKLSAIHTDTRLSNELVNHQIELSVILISPLITGLLIFLPIVIRMLYSADFLAAMPMVSCAWLFMLLKGFNLSMAYIALSKGDSRTYLMVELVCHLAYIVLSVTGFFVGGLAGLGVAMSVSALCESSVLYLCAYRKYRFRFSRRLLRVTLLFIPMLLFAFFLTRFSTGWVYWGTGTICVVITSGISLFLLNKRTNLLFWLFDWLKKRL